MSDLSERFIENPLLSPKDLTPSIEGLEITCLLNPGVFTFLHKTWLVVRVAERPKQKDGIVSFPIFTSNGVEIIELDKNHPDLVAVDPRIISYKGADYLTTFSHLRLLCSDDGTHFYQPDGYSFLQGEGENETFGIEDCRVALLGDTYYLTYTAVSENGVGVGMRTTKDWKTFYKHGMVFPPHNKDCAIFDEKINGKFYAFHRPSSVAIGGNYIWLAESLDGLHWGNHKCIIKTRTNSWDNARVGAGAAPIKTEKGWLGIYHGADKANRYCLGGFLLSLEAPSKVIARSIIPIMQPSAEYEINGFFGQVIFTNGHIVNGDELTIYYGAADEFVCGAKFSIKSILDSLTFYS